jgi:S1-C subfamily serine protease
MTEACEKEARIRPNNDLSDRGIKTRDFCNCLPNKVPQFVKSFDDFILTSQDKQKAKTLAVGIASQCILELMSSTDVKESNKASSNDQQKPLVKSITGSGFFITSEEVVTNHHVVNNCKSIFVNTNNENIFASVIAHSKEKDIAILRVDNAIQSCNVATLRDGKGIKSGDDVVVIGHPLGDLLGSGLKVTKGNVSALFGVRGNMDRMQITAPVQGGNSGGPLLDSSGNVVGIVTAKLDVLKINKMMNDLPQNVNFAVKSSVLREFLDVNNIAYSARQSDQILKTSDIVQRAEQFTIKVICNRN